MARIPDSFQATARRLMRRTGVVGVFWGSKHPGTGERNRICVHVRAKLSCDELPANRVIPRRIDGLPTCVVGVGRPTCHALTLKELVHPIGEPGRPSTLTTMLRDGDAWHGLLSGHGALPIRDGALVTTYDTADDEDDLLLRDLASGARFHARLRTGRVTRVADYASTILAVPDVDDVKREHPATGTYRPPLRTTRLLRDEPLHQYSTQDLSMRHGFVDGYGPARLTLPDGRDHVFTEVIRVFGAGPPFSVEGDSGSLVADDGERAVGVIVGGSAFAPGTPRASYVLPFCSANGTVPPAIRRFFT